MLRRFFSHTAGSLPAESSLPAVPLRRSTLPLDQLRPGSGVLFAEACPLPELRARQAVVRGMRNYRFGTDHVTSYQLSLDGNERFSLAVAEDADGHYLALSRQLDAREQDIWFGRDALGFFMEPSTAKTIRCKADRSKEGAWAAERYIKSVDWIAGQVVGAPRNETDFRYNLLVNETGEKALEIEHNEQSGHSLVQVTVYRPIDDIVTLTQNVAIPPRKPTLVTPEPVVEAEPETVSLPPRQRPDFRRASEDPIHVPPAVAEEEPPLFAEEPPLPSFLTSREGNAPYLSLDEVIGPEPERVRCSLRTAKALIDVSLERGVRVRDVLRDVLGLESAMAEEAIFELPLSDRDYRQLAQRFRVRPDHRDEIRARLQDELRRKLLS